MTSTTNHLLSTQLAVLDASTSYWETVLRQSVAFADVLAQTLQELKSDDPSINRSAQRLIEFSASNAIAFTQLSMNLTNTAAHTLAQWELSQNRPGER